MTPPSFAPSHGLLDALGNALAQTFGAWSATPHQHSEGLGVGSGTPHEASEAPDHVSKPRRERKRQPDVDVPERLVVEGRWGLCEFTGKCVSIVKEWDPSLLRLVDISPVDEEVMIWGRRWIVKTSSLGERHGYGVFACEDIILEDGAGREGPTLFPYGGLIYM